MSTSSRGVTTKGNERAQKGRLGRDGSMRGEDRQEERDELKNQLMLFQLLPRNKKEGKKNR